MKNTLAPPVAPLDPARADEFFAYLDAQIAGNGGDAGYFMPLPRSVMTFPPDQAQTFRAALAVPFGAPGWRRVWIAADEHGIVGHVDLRTRVENFTRHRCVLGMGVDPAQRRRGLGLNLIAEARRWAEASGLEWIDLQVMSQNVAATTLYLRAGFVRCGETQDMFRIDGRSFAFTQMTLRLGA